MNKKFWSRPTTHVYGCVSFGRSSLLHSFFFVLELAASIVHDRLAG